MVVIGPGSLYTSLMPSLLVPGIRAALAATTALRVFVCNVATQRGETEGYTLSEHLAALSAHEIGSFIDVVLVNSNFDARQPPDYTAAPVKIDLATEGGRPRLVTADVVDNANAHSHDPAKLAAALMRLNDERVSSRATSIVRTA
jgi:uncharacterized cofD-like protein